MKIHEKFTIICGCRCKYHKGSASQFQIYFFVYVLCLFIIVYFNTFLNVKTLVGAFNKEKALVGAFSMIVISSRNFV